MDFNLKSKYEKVSKNGEYKFMEEFTGNKSENSIYTSIRKFADKSKKLISLNEIMTNLLSEIGKSYEGKKYKYLFIDGLPNLEYAFKESEILSFFQQILKSSIFAQINVLYNYEQSIHEDLQYKLDNITTTHVFFGENILKDELSYEIACQLLITKSNGFISNNVIILH